VPPGGALTPGGFAARKLATHLGEILRGVSEANIETLRREYAALNPDDLSVVLDLLDSDIECGMSPRRVLTRGRITGGRACVWGGRARSTP
jgi:hypothetical protein